MADESMRRRVVSALLGIHRAGAATPPGVRCVNGYSMGRRCVAAILKVPLPMASAAQSRQTGRPPRPAVVRPHAGPFPEAPDAGDLHVIAARYLVLLDRAAAPETVNHLHRNTRTTPPARMKRMVLAAAVAAALIGIGWQARTFTGGVTPATSVTQSPDTDQSSPPEVDSANTWIAQLASVPKRSGIEARDQALTEIRRTVPGAQTLDSDDFASLHPGYWVVYWAGPFTDGRAALAFCKTVGRTEATDCMGRYLSHETRDLPLICLPHEPTGLCQTTDRDE
ncbi:hypothetical protein ACFWJM_02180 [Streptomyces sp. NPDC127077]|uniref:hypothetical protein n=1 Tax=Streptomyces sp. NPDC127077 TaxID=3347131 RepID=UPI0036548FCE